MVSCYSTAEEINATLKISTTMKVKWEKSTIARMSNPQVVSPHYSNRTLLIFSLSQTQHSWRIKPIIGSNNMGKVCQQKISFGCVKYYRDWFVWGGNAKLISFCKTRDFLINSGIKLLMPYQETPSRQQLLEICIATTLRQTSRGLPFYYPIRSEIQLTTFILIPLEKVY